MDEPRMMRGYAILAKGDMLRQVDKDTFVVPSQSGNGNYAVIKIDDSIWVCPCPDFTYREIEACKHIHATRFWLALREKLHAVEPFACSVAEVSRCKFCSSPQIIRYGKSGRKQVYKCMDCLRKFVPDEGFRKMKFDPKVICACLDLYFKGVSLRKVTDHLKQSYGLKVTHVAIYSWIGKYVSLMSDYVKTLVPELSGKIHFDEMKVKFHGEWRWLWNSLDSQSRFVLASAVSECRETKDARKIFALAKEKLKNRPQKIVTDGLPAYRDALNKKFFTLKGPRTQHVWKAGLRSGLNNRIERLHGTKRGREKVMRSLKKEDTPILQGQDIYYNYLRPHQALDGKTPADMAGVGQGDSWLALIKKSLGHHHNLNTTKLTP